MAHPDQDGVESLASLGARSIAILDQTLTALTQLTPASKFASQAPVEVIAEEFTRFKLWSGNIGLLHHGHASLDYRLRDAPAVERFVRTLLDDLHDAMSNIREVVSGQRLPFEEMEVVESEDEMSDNGSDLGSSSETLNTGTETELGSRVEEIKSIIDRLFRLSTKIRNPASRVGHSKAIMYKDVDRETGVDLMEAHAAHDRLHIEEILRSLRNGIELDVERYGTFLIDRLSEANKRRRQQFKYWRKHREKLARHEVKEQITIPPTGHILEGIDSWTVAKRSQQGTHTHISLPTTATALVQENIDLDDTKSIGSTYSTTTSIFSNETSVMEAERLILPPPPIYLLKGKHFECPYCFTLCSKRYLQVKQWREHLWRDLRPYVCTYEHCQEAFQLYDSRSDWIKHENWAHRRIWRCSHHASEFTSEDDYKKHMQSEHDLPLGNTLDTVALSAISAADSSSRNCPFCLVPLSKVKVSPEQHVSHHLERAASFALPLSTLVDEGSDDEVSAAASGKANTGGGASSAGISEASLESTPMSSPDMDRTLVYEGEELEQVAPPDIEESDASDVGSTRQPFKDEQRPLGLANVATDDAKDLTGETPFDSYSDPTLEQMYSACTDGDSIVVSYLLQQGLVRGQDVWPLLKVATLGQHGNVTKVLWDHIWPADPPYIKTQLNRASDSDGGQTINFLLGVLCETGDAESVRFVLDHVSNGFHADSLNMMKAISNNNTEVVKVLLLHPQIEPLGRIRNALYRACTWGHYETAKILIDGGANPDGNVADCIPLYAAAEIGSFSLVELLLSRGAIIDRPGRTGNTPLCVAAEIGHTDIVALLLDLGADPNRSSLDGYTPLHAASSKAHLDILARLIEHNANIDYQDALGQTPLVLAIYHIHTDAAVALLDCGANPNLGTSKDLTALQIASRRRSGLRIVQSLVSHGAEVDQRGENGTTPLYEAASIGDLEIGNYLSEKGADVDAFCPQMGYPNPLLAACKAKHSVFVEMLLDRGADPFYRHDVVGTVLNLACSLDCEVIVNLILEYTAYLPRNHTFLTSAYFQICVHKRLNLVRVMSDYGVKPDSSALAAAVDSGSVSLVTALVEGGVDIDAQYQDITPLACAIAAHDINMVKALVNLGADVNKPSRYKMKSNLAGTTAASTEPLEIAHSCGFSDLVSYLAGKGANLSFKYADMVNRMRTRRPFHCEQEGCTDFDGFSTVQDLWKHKVRAHDIHLDGSSTFYVCAVPNCPDQTWADVESFKEHIEHTHITTHVDDDMDDLIRRSTVHIDVPPQPGTEAYKEDAIYSSLRTAKSFPDLRSYTPSPVQSDSGEENGESTEEDVASVEMESSHAAAYAPASARQDQSRRKLYILDVDTSIDETEFILYFQQFGRVDEAVLSSGGPDEPSLGLVVFTHASAASEVLAEAHQINGKTVHALPAVYEPTRPQDYGQELSNLRTVLITKRWTTRMPSNQRVLNHLAAAGVQADNLSSATLSELHNAADHLDSMRMGLNRAYASRDVSAAEGSVLEVELALSAYQKALQTAKSEHIDALLVEQAPTGTAPNLLASDATLTRSVSSIPAKNPETTSKAKETTYARKSRDRRQKPIVNSSRHGSPLRIKTGQGQGQVKLGATRERSIAGEEKRTGPSSVRDSALQKVHDTGEGGTKLAIRAGEDDSWEVEGDATGSSLLVPREGGGPPQLIIHGNKGKRRETRYRRNSSRSDRGEPVVVVGNSSGKRKETSYQEHSNILSNGDPVVEAGSRSGKGRVTRYYANGSRERKRDVQPPQDAGDEGNRKEEGTLRSLFGGLR